MTKKQDNYVPTKIVNQDSEEIPGITTDKIEQATRNLKMANLQEKIE